MELGDIPSDADLDKILEEGFELDEISQDELDMLEQDELDMLDVSQEFKAEAECPPAYVKLVPLDLQLHGINAMDFM